jgi:hypothetical protein
VQGGAFRVESDALEQRQARLEEETGRWSFLAEVLGVAAPDDDGGGFEAMATVEEVEARLRKLAALRRGWDGIFGYCAYLVKRSGLWRIAGFTSFEHYCKERLQLAPRTVDQRAALEKRLWEVPELRAARDAGLGYEKLRLLARLPAREVEPWIANARKRTCVELRAALADRDEAQMRAARALRVRVPERVARLLQAAFRAVREVEGCLLDDGRCLVRVARHFIDTWQAQAKKPKTVSQKVRERDLGRCQVPGCSRRAVHAHHIVLRSRGGSDGPENRVALCACHHLRGIHGGYIRVSGIAPDRLVWEVGGRTWNGGDFGSGSAREEPAP